MGVLSVQQTCGTLAVLRPGDTLLETCTTIAYMCKYGWEKVRGGSYCNVAMEKEPAAIQKAKHYQRDPKESV